MASQEPKTLEEALSRIHHLETELAQLRESNHQIRESERQFREITENIPGVVFMYHTHPDESRSPLYAGPGMEELFGEEIASWVRDDVNRFFELVPMEDQLSLREASVKAEEGQSTLDYEYRVKLKEDRYVWIRSISRPVLLEDGTIRWQGVIFDVTEQKKKEMVQKALTHITEASVTATDLSALIESIHDQLSRLLPVENFYVALYNEQTGLYSFPYYQDQYDELEDYEPVLLEGSLTDYVRRSAQPMLMHRKEFEELQLRGELKLVGTDTKLWLGAPLLTDQGVIGVVVVQSYHDENLYDHRDLELMNIVGGHIAVAVERLRAREAERESANLKVARELARAVAHEFRQPLAALMLISDLMRHNWRERGDLSDDTLQQITRSVARIDKLVEKLLTITRVQSKQYAMGMDIVDLDKSSENGEGESD